MHVRRSSARDGRLTVKGHLRIQRPLSREHELALDEGGWQQSVPLANSALAAVCSRRHWPCGPRFTGIEDGFPQLADARECGARIRGAGAQAPARI